MLQKDAICVVCTKTIRIIHKSLLPVFWVLPSQPLRQLVESRPDLIQVCRDKLAGLEKCGRFDDECLFNARCLLLVGANSTIFTSGSFGVGLLKSELSINAAILFSLDLDLRCIVDDLAIIEVSTTIRSGIKEISRVIIHTPTLWFQSWLLFGSCGRHSPTR